MKVRVRQGDTIWYYSQLFSIPIQLLLDSNQENIQNDLQSGQEIHIPGYITEFYEVKTSDTLTSISKQFGIPMDILLLLNEGLASKNIQAGDSIVLPRRITERIVDTKKPYDFKAFQTDLENLKELYPFIKLRSIGESVLGLPLYELNVGRGNKRIHINGSFHANEWITTAIIMTFLNDYLLTLTNMNRLKGFYTAPFYFETSLSIVPMVNPDGVNLVLNGPPEDEPYRSAVIEMNNGNMNFDQWKANIRGVDLNNQFPACWEIEKERKEPKAPAPRDYPGDEPLTEPEALAMANLTEKQNFCRVLAFHTQGKEIYWGYLNNEPAESEAIVNVFAKMSGYKAVRFIDSHAGFKDWFIQEWKRPGFTIELGEGVNPLPLDQFNEIYRDSLGIFLASLIM
jgi:g-D-glutamyl-meso-diaminopimelate peptidase